MPSTIAFLSCVTAGSSWSPQMVLWFACWLWWYKKPSYLILVCIQRQPSMYLYLSIFSYRDLWSCNKNTAVNNKLRGLWKISFEVFNFLLQGWLQLHILHFLMARTAIMTKWKKGFQVIFCICISALYYWILDFFDVMFEVMSFFFVYEACNYPRFKF